MTTITAKIIADSVAVRTGKRITTMQLRYPRWIHAELMTHRVFSRNASSSRAIPVNRLIDDIIDDPAIPLFWGANQKGMQAGAECDEPVTLERFNEYQDVLDDDSEDVEYFTTYQVFDEEFSKEAAWLEARDSAVSYARAFSNAGYHKQIVNRLLEPFSHINVVVTATEWDNFFTLRRHDAAEPHIHLLADRMYEAMEASTPVPKAANEWHLPYITGEDWLEFDNLIKVSVARCARVSYLTHDGKPTTLDEDYKLYSQLVGSHPMHASPAEHQAAAMELPDVSGNFVGWRQYRKILELSS